MALFGLCRRSLCPDNSNRLSHEPADLRGFLGRDLRTRPNRPRPGVAWCCWGGLNSRPQPYQGCALPLSYSSLNHRPNPRRGAGRGALLPRGGRMSSAGLSLGGQRCKLPPCPVPDLPAQPPPAAPNGWPSSCAPICTAARRRPVPRVAPKQRAARRRSLLFPKRHPTARAGIDTATWEREPCPA